MLDRLGHEADAVSSGPEAVRAYDTERYDLVLLDLLMPVMSGGECFDAIRASDPQARVVVVTGLGDGPGARELVCRGAAGVLSKPFGLADLQRVLAT